MESVQATDAASCRERNSHLVAVLLLEVLVCLRDCGMQLELLALFVCLQL